MYFKIMSPVVKDSDFVDVRATRQLSVQKIESLCRVQILSEAVAFVFETYSWKCMNISSDQSLISLDVTAVSSKYFFCF